MEGINVSGLRDISRDELTPEEIAVIEMQDDNAEQERIQSESDSLEVLAQELSHLDNAPNVHDLYAWRDTYGTLQVSSVLGEGDIYIWRTISRVEYKKMLKSGLLNEESRAEDSIVRKHLLWPQPNDVFMNNSNAGIIPVLRRQIMYQSGFVSEQEALARIKVI